MRQEFFEKKIKPVLLYTGSIGAVSMAIAYIILMFVLVLGFKAQTELKQSIIFAVINGVVGFIIMQFLKIQGIAFAKQLPDNVEILKQHNGIKKKKKSTHSLKYFWIKSVSTDILVKVLTICVTTSCIIYIVVEGSNDYNMLLLSVVNLIMFACFGFLSLVRAYDFFNENYIPFLQESIDERKNEKLLEVAKEKSDKQGNVMVHIDRRTDILESSDSNISSCNHSKSMVVDSNDSNNCVLGRTVDTSSSITNSTNLSVEEDI